MSLTRKSFMYYFSVHVIKYESSCVSGMAPSAGMAPTITKCLGELAAVYQSHITEWWRMGILTRKRKERRNQLEQKTHTAGTERPHAIMRGVPPSEGEIEPSPRKDANPPAALTTVKYLNPIKSF